MKVCTIHGDFIADKIGGSERQLDLIEKALIEMGCEVIHIHAQPQANKYSLTEIRSGVKIFHVGSRNVFEKYFYQLRLINFLKENIAGKVDLIYTREFHDLFLLTKFCKEYKIPLFRAITSDSICNKLYQSGFKVGSKYNDLKTTLRKFLSDFAMNNVNKIIAQTNFQKKLIKDNFGLESVVIPNGGIVPNNSVYPKRNNFVISWLGNMRSQKRPELFLELACRFLDSEIKFIMAGPLPNEKSIKKKLIKTIKTSPNVTYLGPLSNNHALKLIERSTLVVNTSLHEGFSNTFIESWFRYVPVLTLGVDPENIISNEKIGVVCDSLDNMESTILDLQENRSQVYSMGERAFNYSVNKFDINKTVKKLHDIFLFEIDKMRNEN